MKWAPQLLTRASIVGNSASTVSGGTPAFSAISARVVAWIPRVVCRSSVQSMIRSRVGSVSSGCPAAASKPRGVA